MIDVAALLEDSETKTEALEKAAELKDELSQVSNERDYVKTKVRKIERDIYIKQGLHRLEKYLNLEGFLEKS